MSRADLEKWDARYRGGRFPYAQDRPVFPFIVVVWCVAAAALAAVV
jgi:hypothetical protein